jgi:LuxR family transcriptional regulator, maltose regulon positive regulatory protein
LRPPLLRPEQLARPGLQSLLRLTSDCKLTLVSAPAGYGKTMLLTQWRETEKANSSFAWVSLDEQDNDPARLWRHIVEALRRGTPQGAPREDFGAGFLVGMNAAGQRLSEITLPMLMNELAEWPQRVVVVLDDYQFVIEDDALASVAFFIEHLPNNVHLVLSSRSDPQLPLGRLRARGEITEIRTEQLAFSEEEAASLLNEKMGLDIDPDDLLLLMNSTEGWPAGLYLASLSLRHREDKHAFIESFGGSNRYVLDLLGEEVLAGLSEEVREFLLRTSVLRRMTGPLCDAVTGRGDSGMLLRELARSNLFVVPLDEQGEWYRYHHLFSDLLLYELRSSQPELMPVVHGRASVWLEGEGFFEPAIRHAIAAEDYERGGMLIARYWYGYFFVGQTSTLERWLDALPEVLINSNGPLLLVKAWISALYGRGEERERFLALAEGSSHEGELPDGTASVESGVATIRAVFAYGGVQDIAQAARRAAALDPDQTSPQATLVRLGLGQSSYLSGDLSGARRALEGALRLMRTDQPLPRLGVLFALSLVATDEGRMGEAESLAREAVALVDRFGLQGVPQAALAYIALGRVLAERGNLADAQVELEKGLSGRPHVLAISPWGPLIGLLALAPVRAALGDRAGGRAVLKEAREILEAFPDAGVFPELLEREERKLRTRRPREGQLDGEVTQRELDVLRLLSGELSTRQMAQSLYVAPSTVRTQVKSIYRKLGVSSRKEAVDEAHARGLI